MKQIVKKLTALVLVISLFISNSNILLRTAVLSIAADGTEQAETEITINQAITKYIPYAYSDEDCGIILQQSLSVIVPEATEMQESKYTIAIPTYSEIAPETIEITTKTAPLTQDNTQKAYYTVEENVLTITQKEKINEEYYITYYYGEEAYKKYLESTHVTEYPDGEIARIEKDEETGEVWAYIDFSWDPEENEGEMPEGKHLVDKIPIEINAKCEVVTQEETLVQDSQFKKDLDLAINSEITNEVKANITEISKGNLYTKKEVEFEVENKLNITRSDIFTKIRILDISSNFVSKDESLKDTIIEYNKIIISKNDFDKLLGTVGCINVLDANEEVITSIDSTKVADEDGNYVFEYPAETKKVILEVTGIENNGFLTIKQSKTIIAEQGYTKNEIIEFKSLQTLTKVSAIGNNEITQEDEQIVEILLKETATTANLKINNNNLYTDDENTGLEFTVELKNNNQNSDLWANPFIIIEMPDEVESVKVNSKNIVYGQGLTILSTDVVNLHGKQAIKIQLVGEQQELVADTILAGTTIMVNANITLKELTSTNENNEIKLYYYNANKTNYTNSTVLSLEEEYEVGYNTLNVNYIAPIEFKTIHKISEFDEFGTVVSSSNSTKEVGKIKILEPEKEVKYTVTLMNNTGNETTSIKTLGRLPFKGNKDIILEEDLQTTVNAILSKQIICTSEVEKVISIYYSENENADTDLNKDENAWKTEITDFQNIKSFMIIVDNIKQGEKLFFEYNVKIPAMLEHNENLYSSLVTYYTNNTDKGAVAETAIANTVGVSTGIGARAQIELSAGIDTDTMFSEGQKVTYTIKVSNTGELPAEDVVVLNPIPEGTTYVEETVVKNEIETFSKYTYYSDENQIKWEIGKLEPNQTAELEYTLIINNIPSILEYYGAEDGFTEEDGMYYILSTNELGDQIRTPITDVPDIAITNKAILQASNIEKELISNELKNDVRKSYFDIQEEASIQSSVYIEEGQEYSYIIVIENKTDLRMNNIQITKKIPDGVTYKDTEIVAGEAKAIYENNNLTITADAFEANGIVEIIVNVVADKLDEGVQKKQIITNTEVKAEGKEANTSSSVKNTIGKPQLTATLECDVKQRYIYEKDILNYTVKVTNSNDVTASNLTLTNIIPENTKFVTGSYIKDGNEYNLLSDGTRNIVLETNLTEETVIMKIKVEVENIYSSEEEIEIINTATMKTNSTEETTIGEIKHTVVNLGSDEEGKEDGGNPPIGGETGEDGITRYKIKGSAWEDSNKDGERQDNEDNLNGIRVYLIDEKGNIIQDYQTKQDKTTTTDIDGEYEFNNIEKGKYMVVYMFDNTKYNVTEYQKTGVVNDRNSDAILTNIIFAGEEKQVAVTDIIEVTDRNLYSIDLGLKQKEKFNMMLEAGISSIIVKTKEGTKQTAYDMSKFAKIEIKAKEVNGASVIIEYSLKITNNGEIAGSASQIVTNKVKELNFTSSANKDWYEGNDGNLYLIGLSNIILQPGESTTVKLVLVKQMTTTNTGAIENNFTITKTYNNHGQEETTLEDNSQKVNCIITISTGQTIIYTGLTTISLTILAIGVYMIRKTLKEEKRWI